MPSCSAEFEQNVQSTFLRPQRGRKERLFGCRPRGTWANTAALEALGGLSPRARLLLLYIRCVARVTRYLPTLPRLARVSGWSEDEVGALYAELQRGGYLTNQWLGRGDLQGGRWVYITTLRLRLLDSASIGAEDQIRLFRLLPFVGKDRFVWNALQLAEASGMEQKEVTCLFRRLRKAGVMTGDRIAMSI